MTFDLIIIFSKVFGVIYKWLNHHFIAYLLNFAKEFELVIIIIAAILFLLFNVYLTIKYLKKLPKYYVIEVVDLYENKTKIESLRLIFATYDAAESYARFYQDIYKDEYKFKVTGIKK
jgi:hypothetical protein